MEAQFGQPEDQETVQQLTKENSGYRNGYGRRNREALVESRDCGDEVDMSKIPYVKSVML